MGNFKGLPSYCRNVINKMHSNDTCNQILASFRPVELCNLDYSPDRGSAIDPHFDDFWLWGDRLVTVNLLSGTVLTLSKDEYEVCHDRLLNVVNNPNNLMFCSHIHKYRWIYQCPEDR